MISEYCQIYAVTTSIVTASYRLRRLKLFTVSIIENGVKNQVYEGIVDINQNIKSYKDYLDSKFCA